MSDCRYTYVRICLAVYMKVCNGQLSSVKIFMDDCQSDTDDISNVELLLLTADKLPPNQRVVLLNLFEEVTDLLKEKCAEVESILQSVENADSAYRVTVSYYCFLQKGNIL